MPYVNCPVPGCNALYPVGAKCPIHGANHARRSSPSEDRIRKIRSTKRWKTVRAARLELDGRQCTFGTLEGERAWTGTSPGRCPVTVEIDAHHIVPIEDGGEPYELENTRTLCRTHHGQIDAELRRARRAA